MASVNHICHLCEEEDVSNVAVVWCADCETFLCKDCERHHSKNRASKGHQTITLDEYKKLPSFIADIKSRCEKHDEKYNFYCKFHGEPCCVKCIKDNHKDCRDLDPLVDVLRDIKTSAKLASLDKEFSVLLGNLESISKYLDSRQSSLQENKTESLKDINNLRASINKHLDEIENKIVDDLSVEFKKIKLKFDHLMSEIENKKKVIQNLQNDLSKMKMHATDFQTYVGLQYFEKSKSTEVEYLNDLQSNGHLDNIRIESKLSSDLKCLTNNIRTFGTTVTHQSACTLQLKTCGEFQVHLSVPAVSKIESIEPKLKATLKIPFTVSSKLCGCQILPDGRLLILDGGRQNLLLYSKDGKFPDNIQGLDGQPSDVCFIKDSLTAVTIYDQHKILLIDIKHKVITKTIEVADVCYGIDSNGDTLVVKLLGNPKKILTLDLEGNMLSEIRLPGEFTIRIALHKENIVVTDWKANLISCYTNNGVLVWTYKHEDIREPFGITVDKNGIIYVACKGNDKIVVLSEDGKTSKTILSKVDGIVNPFAINIDKTSSSLLVTNVSNGEAYLFDI